MVFWSNVCCWVISLRTACIIIAIYLVISETTLFIVSIVAGEQLFEIENDFYTYPANMMYFPVAAFGVQIIACLCLIVSAVWNNVRCAQVWVGYQVLELVVFIVVVMDQTFADQYTPDELILNVRGGPQYYVFQIATVLLKLYFLYIVGSWVQAIKAAEAIAQEEARMARSEARMARRARIAAQLAHQS